MFLNKTVAILGNANIEVDIDAVEAHDIVIQINRAPWSTRCDVYCYSGQEFINQWKPNSTKVFHMSPKDRGLVKDDSVEFYPMEHWQELVELLKGARPTTGMMVIDMVRRRGGKISLFGFDWYVRGHCASVHEPGWERKILGEWGYENTDC